MVGFGVHFSTLCITTPTRVLTLLTLIDMNSTPDSPVFYTDIVSAFGAAMLMENRKERNLEIQQLEDHYKSLNWITDWLLDEIVQISM